MITDKEFMLDRLCEFAVRRIHSAIEACGGDLLTLRAPTYEGRAWTVSLEECKDKTLERLELEVFPELDAFLTYKRKGREQVFSVLRLEAEAFWPLKNAALELVSVATGAMLLLAIGNEEKARRALICD